MKCYNKQIATNAIAPMFRASIINSYQVINIFKTEVLKRSQDLLLAQQVTTLR